MKKIFTLSLAILALTFAYGEGDVNTSRRPSDATVYLDQDTQLYFYLVADANGNETAEVTFNDGYVCNDDTNNDSYDRGTYVIGDLVIPDHFTVDNKDYTVTSIDNSTFASCKQLTSVKLPETLLNIGSYAFYRSGLKSVHIPKSVNTLEYGSFMYCDYVETLTFDEDIEPNLEHFVFDRLGSKADEPLSVLIPKGFKNVPRGTFRLCSNFEKVTFAVDSEVTELGRFSFYKCTILKNIELPDELEKIKYQSFYMCDSMETVFLPASVKDIETGAFYLNSDNSLKSFYCKAATPPNLINSDYSSDDTEKNNFVNINDDAVLYVPDASAYSSWSEYFKTIKSYDFPDFKYNDIYYKIIDGNQVQVVSGPIPYEGEIEIPTTFTRNKTEYTVSSIANDAFSNIDGDLTVTLSFADPSVISTVDAVENKNVTIKVPVGYKEIFEVSGLADYFNIDGDPITDSYGNSYYYYYNDDEEGGLLLELVAIADGVTDLTIPESVDGVAVKSIAEGVITSDLTSVTLQAENPQFKADTFKDVAVGTVVLYVGENIENYVTTDNDYHEYFVVYGYIEANDKFSDGTFEYIVLENDEENNEGGDTGWIVKITDIVTSETSFTIATSVNYNGLTFTVKEIADSAFEGKSGLTVSVTFTDPSTITLGKIATLDEEEYVGSLHVPTDNELTFANSDWGEYFKIENYNVGTIFVENGISYMVNDDNTTVTIVAFSCAESVTIPTTAGGYAVNAIADDVFNCADLKSVTMEATTPPFSASAFKGIPEGVVLYVGDIIENYTTTDDNWHNYFVIYGYVEVGDTFELDGLEYKVITNTETIEIIGITASEVEIKTAISYNNLNFTVTNIADGAFEDAENLSVTVDADITESISLGKIAEGNIGELKVPKDYAWNYYLSDWSSYFTINATLSFETTELVYTVTDQTRKYVEISGVIEKVTTFEITTTVTYLDTDFTVKSINEYAFDDCSDLQVTVAFTNPSTVTFNGYYEDILGTLTVTSEGYRDFFASTSWGKYFDVVGNPYTQDGVNYYFQRDGSATVDSVDSEAEIIFTDKVNGYTVEEIAESVFENCANLTVAVTVINPYTIMLETRTTSGKYGILTVPDGCSSIYAETTWGDYFDIKATDYYDGGAGVYYVFIVTAVEYDDEDFEDDTNKSLKATSVKYEISLEVAYVDADATEITIPRTVDLGDSSSTYEVTSMNADALKDCKDLVTINLEASIPVEDIEALNYTPDACVIVLDEEKMGTDYCESVVSAAAMVGIEVKMVQTSIVEVKIEPEEVKVEVERYNLLGQKVNAPVRGINIIRYADGTVEKVLVK